MKTNFKNILKFLICLCMCVLAGVFFAACSAIQSDYRYKGGGSSDSGSSSGGSGGSSGGQGGSGDVTPDVPTGDEITIRYDYGADSKLFGEFNELTLYETIKTNVGIVKLPTIKSQYSDAFLGWFDVSTDEKVKIGDKPQTDIDVYAKFDINKVTFVGLFENGKYVKIWDDIKKDYPDAFFGTAIMSNSGDSYLTGLQGDLVIGSEITEIQAYAFSECELLTSVVIPDSVTTIGEHAFDWCSKIQTLKIGKSVTSIGEQAFAGCAKIENVYYNSVNCGDLANTAYIFMYIGQDADRGCIITIGKDVTYIPRNLCRFQPSELVTGNLRNVVFEDGSSLSEIGVTAFYGCTGLASVTIPNGVTSIGMLVFGDCTSLTSVTIGGGVTSIGEFAFYGCSGLISITLPNSLTTIDRYVFYNCSGLISITLPNSVTSIGTGAFSGCTGLASVTLPNSVTSIGTGAFSGCSGLASVTLPNSVTSIGNVAFSGCSGLTSITLPNSLTTIGLYAFENCSGLTSVVFENVSGWKAGLTALAASNLSNDSTAATYLKNTYVSSYWTRE